MQTLQQLTQEAQALARGDMLLTSPEKEVARQLQICNGCRYCEGFCAVFPAMTRRLEFGNADHRRIVGEFWRAQEPIWRDLVQQSGATAE